MSYLFKGSVCVVLVGVVAAIGAANFLRDPAFSLFKWKLNREAPIEVKLAQARRGRIIRTVEAPGKIEADVEVKISSQVVGRIIKLGEKPLRSIADGANSNKETTRPIMEGDKIEENELLVQLDKIQYQAEVGSAKARVERLKASIALTNADLAKSLRDMERSLKLSGGAISQAELADLETLYKKDLARLSISKAELIEAEAALTKVEEDLARTTIRSPIHGIVSQLLAKEGEVVVIGTMNQPGTVILSVSDPDTRVVRARIDENNIALVQEHQKVAIHLQNDDGLALTGYVLRISPKGIRPGGAASTTSSTDNDVAIFETIIKLDSPPPQVRLGMNANVVIQVDERQNVLAVPTQAVLHRQARELPEALRKQIEEQSGKGPGVRDPSRRYHQVVFINDNGTARCRLVKTGISDESQVEILNGLDEGDSVIVGPYRVFEKLKDGKPIKELVEQDDNSEKSSGSAIQID